MCPTSLRSSLKQKRVFNTTGPRDLGDTELNVLEVKPQIQERAQPAIAVKGAGGGGETLTIARVEDQKRSSCSFLALLLFP